MCWASGVFFDCVAYSWPRQGLTRPGTITRATPGLDMDLDQEDNNNLKLFKFEFSLMSVDHEFTWTMTGEPFAHCIAPGKL